MLKDELELITGTLIGNSVTPTIYKLLRDSPEFEKICKDIGVRRDVKDVSTPSSSEVGGVTFGDRFDVLRWLTEQGQLVTL